MNTAEVLVDAFTRIHGMVHNAVAGLTVEQLAFRPDPEANSIGWLVWHLTRVQDDHVAGAAGTRQVWTTAGWCDQFALPFDNAAIGYGQHSDEVELVRATAGALVGYFDAVHAQTVDFVGGIGAADLDRIVDESWDPPVTLGVRLVSVITDDVAHAGQAEYVRGIVERSVNGSGTRR
jgi:hypothetical protein